MLASTYCEALISIACALPEIQNRQYCNYIIPFSFLHCDVFQRRTILWSYVPGSQNHHCEQHSAGLGFYSICPFSFQLSHQRTLIRCRGAMIQWQAYRQLEEEPLALHITTLVPLALSRDPTGTTVKWLTFNIFGLWRAFCFIVNVFQYRDVYPGWCWVGDHGQATAGPSTEKF